MARRTIVISEDDLDGTPATTTREVTYQGVEYSLDLNDEHAQQLDEALAPWLEAGRRVGGRRRSPSAPSASGPGTREIRDWAVNNGFEVAPRGRLSEEVREAYAAANGGN